MPTVIRTVQYSNFEIKKQCHIFVQNFYNSIRMLQSTTLGSHRIMIQADEESDLYDLLNFLKQSDTEKKVKLLNCFLDFAKDHYATEPSFKFNREELYARENIR